MIVPLILARTLNPILVIDDDPLNIKLISTYLSNYGYKVIGAENGHDGIELAVNSGPDLILLDILMPKLNGFETCIILKENTKTEKIPIIFLTALAESVSIKKAFEIGGVDYVTKPIEFNGLLARIATHLKLKNMNRALEHEVQEKTIELQSANVELIKLLSEKELFLKELNHRTKNNLAVIVSMISLHAEEIKDQKLSNILTEISNKIRKIFSDFTDLVEPLSLDEAFLDVSEYPSATMVAQEIREKIFSKTGLTASAGISINKFLAKIASDWNKPNGQKTIPPEEVLSFLENLDVKKFHGIGTSELNVNIPKETQTMTLTPEKYSEDVDKVLGLTERELNALLAKNTDLSDKLVIDLSDNLLSVKLLIPVYQEFPVIGGKTIKVTAGMELAF